MRAAINRVIIPFFQTNQILPIEVDIRQSGQITHHVLKPC